MLVVPVSFGVMATLVAAAIGLMLFFFVSRALRSVTRTEWPPRAPIARAPSAPLTWSHRAFALGVPLTVVTLVLIAALAH